MTRLRVRNWTMDGRSNAADSACDVCSSFVVCSSQWIVFRGHIMYWNPILHLAQSKIVGARYIIYHPLSLLCLHPLLSTPTLLSPPLPAWGASEWGARNHLCQHPRHCCDGKHQKFNIKCPKYCGSNLNLTKKYWNVLNYLRALPVSGPNPKGPKKGQSLTEVRKKNWTNVVSGFEKSQNWKVSQSFQLSSMSVFMYCKHDKKCVKTEMNASMNISYICQYPQ